MREQHTNYTSQNQMVREILVYPDKRLYQKSIDVVSFDEKLYYALDDMFDTMSNRNGIGLAAIQIGVPLNIVIINITDKDDITKENLLEIINPVILEKSGSQKYKEGCLSVPEFYEEITRADFVRLSYFNRFGEKRELTANGLLAVAIQHEMDHLNGNLFIEKLSIIKRKKKKKEWKSKKRHKL
jgi:peptide deformylase